MSWLQTGLIVIGKPAAEHVSINITDRNSEGWLSGTLEVSAGAWSGRCGAWFYKGELCQFAAEIEKLYGDLIRPAQFTPMEPCLELKLTGRQGHILVEGKAQDRFLDGNYVAFRLVLGQTELPVIANALRMADQN